MNMMTVYERANYMLFLLLWQINNHIYSLSLVSIMPELIDRGERVSHWRLLSTFFVYAQKSLNLSKFCTSSVNLNNVCTELSSILFCYLFDDFFVRTRTDEKSLIGLGSRKIRFECERRRPESGEVMQW